MTLKPDIESFHLIIVTPGNYRPPWTELVINEIEFVIPIEDSCDLKQRCGFIPGIVTPAVDIEADRLSFVRITGTAIYLYIAVIVVDRPQKSCQGCDLTEPAAASKNDGNGTGRRLLTFVFMISHRSVGSAEFRLPRGESE